MTLYNNISPTYDTPQRDDLNDFILKNGTYMIDNGIAYYVENNKKGDYESGRLNLFRSNIYEDIDNQIEKYDGKKETIEHICKKPDSMYILKSDDSQNNYFEQDKICSLKHLFCVSIFVKKVLKRPIDKLEKDDSDELPFEMNEIRNKIKNDMMNESSIPWDKKMPCHECYYNRTDRICHCDNILFNHHAFNMIDSIRMSFETNAPFKIKDFSFTLELNEFDSNNFIPWRNHAGDIVFEKKKAENYGNAIDAVVKVGILKVMNLCNIPNFDVEFLVLGIDNIFFCPLGKKTQGPHICYINGCDQMLASGYTGCSLTGIQLRDKNGSWVVTSTVYDSRTYSHNKFNCQKAFSNKPSHINLGVTTDELKKKEDSFYDAMNQLTNPEQMADFAEKLMSTSSTRSIVEKALRERIKDKLIDIGSEESTKMAKSGHFSDYETYILEAYFTINNLLKFGTKSFTAMLITMEKLMNNNYYMLKKDKPASSSDIDKKQNKITLVVNNKQINRKRLLPESFMITTTAKKHNLNNDMSSSSTALIETNQETSLSIYNPTVTLADDKIFNEIEKTIDEADVVKNLEAKIYELTEKTVKFWALLRNRTRRGKRHPNDFNFNIFIYSFLYLLRDGLMITVERPNMASNRISFFEKDTFLKNALPESIHDLKKYNIVNHGKKDASVVYKNVKETISSFIDSGGDFTYIHPDLQDKLDFSLYSEEFPPSIWVSLHKKRNINK